MNGKEIRLNKFLGKGRNVVVVALDHGAEFGPIDGLTDFGAALRKLGAADGILMNPGMLDHSGSFFAEKNAPRLIIRTTWTTAYCFPWNYEEAHTCVVISPEDALYRGADIVMACCLVQSGDEAVDRENVELFSEIVEEKERVGIPLIGELYPMQAEEIPEAELHEKVLRGARILVELGADAIKTFYTGKRFSEVVESVPVPILALGASKKDEMDALNKASAAINSGARGVVFGRNVFQSKDPARFLKALGKVVRKGIEPGDAMP